MTATRNKQSMLRYKGPRADYPIIVDIQTSGWSPVESYGFHDKSQAKEFAFRHGEWSIREWDGHTHALTAEGQFEVIDHIWELR